jgi:uncharacterized repeat protein (TIGR03806 family)
MVEPCSGNRRHRHTSPLIWMLLGSIGVASAPILGSCSRGSDDTESVQRAATITRVANTTLQLPSGGAATYSLVDAFPTLTFTAPIAMATPPGETNRLFVVERAGRIQVIPNLANPGSSPTKFLDISSRVSTSGEEGLLGLAFHPSYASNGFFYVFYSTIATVNGVTKHFERVSRFKVSSDPNVADGASEQVMIDQADDATNHNGGDLHFGADGYLYISVGDEGQGNDTLMNSQRIDKDFFSGILRIDVDNKSTNLAPNPHVPDPATKDPSAVKPGTYRVPADNPFVNATSFNGSAVTPSKVRTEFWAVGLRNPFRFSFDPPTGQLWVGDVGQDTREEIDIIEKGKNYGWNFREGKGARPTSGAPPAGAVFTDPIFDYATSTTEGKAVIGGVIYRGTALSELSGVYIYGDNTSGNVWSLTQTSPGVYTATKLTQEAGVNAFGVDPRNGDLLISILGGHVRRLVRNSGGGTIPALLSQTGAFSNLATLTPNAGIVPYAPNVAFWSDNAIKTRWFSIPDVTKKITFATDSNWTFPTGQVWIKHFDMEMVRGDPSSKRRLETRFLVKTANGAYGITYKWNAAQTDADLVPDAGQDEDLTINVSGTPTTQTWRYPSRTQCMVCHTAVGGTGLSFNTRQLNGNFTYSGGTDNQIQALSDAGYFTAAVTGISSLPKVYAAGDTTQSLETRARSYLQVNCAQCHQPGGTGLGNWDARIKTPLSMAGIINGVLADNGGDTANQVLVPQDPSHTMLLRRMQAAPNAPRMPPLASNVLDQTSITLVTDWVNSIVPPLSFEAESLSRTSTPASTVQGDANTSGGQWIQYPATGVGGFVDYTVPSLAAGTYAVKLKYKTNANRAQITLKVDGTQVGGTLEQYASSVTYPEQTFGNVTLASSGAHTIRLTVVGKNASSTAFNVSADLFTFVPAGPPPPPPVAPSNLVASGGVGQASLTWTDNSSNETGFKVERKVQGAADTTYVAVVTTAANVMSFTNNIAAGSYTYRVKATNGNGDSTPSNSADATVTAPPPPVAPSNLVATGGAGQASLTWTDNSSDETGFKVERKVQGAADTTYVVLNTTAANIQAYNDNVAAGSYTYRVKATNSNGDAASNTADATVTAPSGPAAPSNLVIAVSGGNSADLTWTDNSSNETGFRIEKKVGAGAYATLVTKAANSTTHSDSNLAPGTYTYRVIATGTPDSAPSNEATVVIVKPAADAHVRDGTSAAVNFGANTSLEQKFSTVAGNFRRTFVRFPLAGVTSTVSSAKLRLFGNSVVAAKLVGVYAVADITWGETTITWNNAPVIGAKQGGSVSVGLTAAWNEWDVTAYVQAQKAAGAAAVTFELKQDVANNDSPTVFNSKENAANQPLLVVSSTP